MTALALHREPGDEPKGVDPMTLADIHAEITQQVGDAIDLLHRPIADFLAWPYAALDAMVGRIPPASVSYVVAFSGTGKSTVTTSCVDRWYGQGKRIFLMPLETQPKEWRVRWGCHRLGINPGDVLGGILQRDSSWPDIRARLTKEIHQQSLGAMKESGLWVDPVQHVTAKGLTDALDAAADWQADVVIVDHIDHISGGNGNNPYAESLLVNKAALQVTQQNSLRLLCTSQANLNIARADRLSKYAPPQVGDVRQGNHKLENATQVIGLYRPWRDRDPVTEPLGKRGTDDAYLEAMRAARAGTAEPWTALKPNTMGVVTMKLRNQGKNLDGRHRHEGARCELGVEHGRVVDIPERDYYRTTERWQP